LALAIDAWFEFKSTVVLFSIDSMYHNVVCIETFEKCSILFKAKKGESFNHRNTLSILRIKI